MTEKLTYKDAGVDIDAGNRSVQLIKDCVKATYRPEVLGDLGGFGGLFALQASKYKEPVLVSGTDGVGTKCASTMSSAAAHSPCSSLITWLWASLTRSRWQMW